ncbi:sulfate/molybdate ABC transporter ATP-binding protein [Spirosoma fluviale]|uniref:Molybdate transport system ATP-binding protein n=1 Tax=Spirosoma fluviale TaxID=1597977 RepID=A0A286FI24_9BACT|nr:ATP-binding cassette domain-containing protein [Spirosoma fluviale]SOD82629.1 molybdate transport system ATP-binding protein [Spirosoma fluviale]
MIHLDVVMPRLFTEGTRDLQVRLDIQTGTLTALIGPSGSGKTTLLRLLAGLENPSKGRITVNEEVWLDKSNRVNLPPQQRSIGFVFQDTALFPNMTVLENIQFAARKDQPDFLQELISATGLNAFVNTRPAALSGGQRQRVALARALVRQPKLLLLDEPFAALDSTSSQQLRQVLLELHTRWGTTTLLVSHHAADVKALADRVVQLMQGRIQSDSLRDERLSTTPVAEPITRITYDEVLSLWVIETATTQIRSANPAWEQWKVGDLLQLSARKPDRNG